MSGRECQQKQSEEDALEDIRGRISKLPLAKQIKIYREFLEILKEQTRIIVSN
jgi:hypothetical protein